LGAGDCPEGWEPCQNRSYGRTGTIGMVGCQQRKGSYYSMLGAIYGQTPGRACQRIDSENPAFSCMEKGRFDDEGWK
jgi:hypothetical protein